MKEETKKIFSATEIGVLIEDFEGQVQTLAEGVTSIGERMNRGFKAIADDFAKVNERLDGIDEELSVIRSDLKEKVGRDEFRLLEAKVLRLEKNLLIKK